MKFLQNLPIRIKVLLAPLLLVLGLVILAVLGIFGLGQQYASLEAIHHGTLVHLRAIDDFVLLSEQVQSDVFQISVLQSMDLPVERILPVQARLETRLNDLNILYGQMLINWDLDQAEKEHLTQIKTPLDTFYRQSGQAARVVIDDPALGVMLVRSTAVAFEALRVDLDALRAYEETRISQTEQATQQRTQTITSWITLVAVGITLTGIGATMIISTHLIIRPISAMTGAMTRLADGDLAISVVEQGREDEIGAMARAVEVFRQNAIDKARVEQALRESEQKLRNIVEYSTNMFFSHTPEHVLTYLSPQVKELLGYEPVEAMMCWTTLATDHPVNLRGLEIAQKAIDTGQAQPPYELELQHKQGHAVWVEVREAPLVADGKTVSIVGSVTNITERKQAEDQLRENEQLLRTIAENYPHSYISIVEQDLTIGFTSGQEFRNQNLDPEQFVGLSLEQVFGEQTPVVREHYLKTFAGQEQSFELFANNQYQLYRSVPLYTEDGTISRILSVVENITERKQAEEKIRAHNAFLDSVMEQSPFAMWIADATGTISRTNRTLRESLHLTDEQILNRYNILQDGNMNEQGVMPQVRAVFEQRKPARFSIPWMASEVGHGDFAGGRDLWIDVAMFPILDSAGQIANVVCQWADITERVQAENELRVYRDQLENLVAERTRALEEAQEQIIRQERLSVLGQLSGSIAHELRTPLGAIKNAVYLLNIILETTDAQTQETLDILANQIKSSEQIIDNLLDFARTRQPQTQPVNLNQAMTEALSRLNVPEGVRVRQDLADLPTVSADPGQLGQILGNLMLNAIQAMPKGGRLTLRTYLAQPERVTIAITDTGVGIPPENRQRLFEPLFTTKSKGIGLGLALVKMLVDGHGGSIDVQSEVGKGTTFTVSLPVHANPDAEM